MSAVDDVLASYIEPKPYLFLFIGTTLLVGACVKHFGIGSRIPYTIIMFILGALSGLLADFWSGFRPFVSSIEHIPPNYIFYIFFPVLIFEASFNSDIPVLRAMWKPVMLLAFPGVLLVTYLTAMILKFIMYPEWTWPTALLYGSILSATDPVATIAVLRELGADKYIRTLLDGESVLNDGCAILLYSIFLPSAVAGEWHMSVAGACAQFLKLLVGAILVGLLFGYVLVRWLQQAKENIVEITLTYIISVLAYFFADDICKVSGVFTLAVMGFCFAYRRYVIQPSNARTLNAIWDVLVHVANTVLFTMTGVLVTREGFQGMTGRDLGMCVFLYIVLQLTRGLMLLVAWPFLNFSRHVTWNEWVLLVHSGLRGAVALTLTLAVRHDHRLPKVVRHTFLFLTAGSVILTLLVNGLTVRPLLNWIGSQCGKGPNFAADRKELHYAAQDLVRTLDFKIYELGMNEMFQSTNVGFLRDEKNRLLRSFHPLLHEIPDVTVSKELDSARRIYMRVFESLLLDRDNQSLITCDAFHILLHGAQKSIEERRIMVLEDFIWTHSGLHVFYYLRSFIQRLVKDQRGSSLPSRLWLRFQLIMAYSMILPKLAHNFSLQNFIHPLVRSGLKQIVRSQLKRAEILVDSFKLQHPELSVKFHTLLAHRLMVHTASERLRVLQHRGTISIENYIAVETVLKNLPRTCGLCMDVTYSNIGAVLRQNKSLASLSEDELQILEEDAFIQCCESESPIPCIAGQLAFLISGKVRHSFTDVQLGEGMVFGESCTNLAKLFDLVPTNHMYVCHSDSVFLILTRKKICSFASSNKILSDSLLALEVLKCVLPCLSQSSPSINWNSEQRWLALRESVLYNVGDANSCLQFDLSTASFFLLCGRSACGYYGHDGTPIEIVMANRHPVTEHSSNFAEFLNFETFLTLEWEANSQFLIFPLDLKQNPLWGVTDSLRKVISVHQDAHMRNPFSEENMPRSEDISAVASLLMNNENAALDSEIIDHTNSSVFWLEMRNAPSRFCDIWYSVIGIKNAVLEFVRGCFVHAGRFVTYLRSNRYYHR